MRRAPTLAAAVAVAALSAASVHAQTAAPTAGQAAGLRYLSWNGHAAAEAASPAAPTAAVGAPGPRRPNRVIPHGGSAATPTSAPRGLTPAPGAARRTLTPANAWMQPAPPPPPQPSPAAPAPRPTAPAQPLAQPLAHPPARTTPDYLPDQGGRGQPVPAEVVAPAAVDPMAPRRDAPIFRIQRGEAAGPPPSPAAEPAAAPAESQASPASARVAVVTANPADRPAVQGARYYSVHRQAGREPDPLSLPEPTYVDAMAMTLPETLSSQDLAQPAEPPTMIRDAQGRLRAAPAASDGDHQ